jgi:hypothetical protein
MIMMIHKDQINISYVIVYLKCGTKLNIRAVDVHKDGQHGLGRTGIVDHLQEKE